VKISSEQAQRLLVIGMVSELPTESQQKVQEAKDKLAAILKDFGEEGSIAFALVGLEMAAEGEKS